MTFKFHCTCGQKVSATSDMIGTRATCPRCGASVKVPKPPDEPAPAPPPAVAPASVQKSEESSKAAFSPPVDTARKASTSAPSEPAMPKDATAEPKQAPAPTPLKIVPRRVGLIWTVAGATAAVAVGLAAFLAWNHWDLIPKSAGIPLAVILVALPLGAVVLRQLSRLVLRFDLGFSESLPVTVLTVSLALLALLPAALSLVGRVVPEQGARLLPLTIGAALILAIAAYGFLIRNALGRPVGVALGTITFLIHLAAGLLSAGVIAELAKLVRS